VVSPPSGRKRPQQSELLESMSDVSEKTLEFFQKTLEFFQKTWEIFPKNVGDFSKNVGVFLLPLVEKDFDAPSWRTQCLGSDASKPKKKQQAPRKCAAPF